MYILLNWLNDDGTIGLGYFRELKNLSFTPQVDLTGNSLPASEYSVDVVMPEGLPGELTQAVLYDEIGQEWCEWPPRKVQRITGNYYRLTCTSRLLMLDDVELEPKMYTGEDAEAVIDECFYATTSRYTVAEALRSVPINGFCPAQTARERLTWVLFVIGAYADDTFTEQIEIKAVDETAELIPLERTFARPTVDRRDWVTGLSLTTYTFREGTEAEWQSDDNSYMFPTPWIATPQTFTLANPAAPSDARENVITFDSLYLITPSNVSAIAARLAKYWFNPTEASLDCVNNRQYKPGDLVQAYTDTDRMVLGYVQQMNSRFGKQSRATLKLIGATEVECAKLTVRYTYENGIIGQAKYTLPVGYAYSVTNPYLEKTKGGRRRVYRPQDSAITGTLPAGGATVTQPYDIALEYYKKQLTVYSVDGIAKQDDTGVIQ